MMGAVRRAARWPSDRIEFGMGGTPGFPDAVFWIAGQPLPVEFKIGRIVNGDRLRFDLRPEQKLWWRHAALEDRRALLVASVGKALYWLRPSLVFLDPPGGYDVGLAFDKHTTGFDGEAINRQLECGLRESERHVMGSCAC